MRERVKPAGETRAADVLHRMRADIISCTLKPGAKLRFEALRDMYSVSFSTLREALSRLVAEGLVIAEDQRGQHGRLVGRQRRPRGLCEPAPDLVGRTVHRSRRAEGGRTLGRKHRDREVTSLRFTDLSAKRHRLPGHHPRVLAARSEDDDPA